MSDVLLLAKLVVGQGDGTITLEPRQNAVRIKTRHGGEIYLRNDSLEAVGRALLEAAANLRRART